MHEYAILRIHDQRGRDRQADAERYRLARQPKKDQREFQGLKNLARDLRANKRLRPAY